MKNSKYLCSILAISISLTISTIGTSMIIYAEQTSNETTDFEKAKLPANVMDFDMNSLNITTSKAEGQDAVDTFTCTVKDGKVVSCLCADKFTCKMLETVGICKPGSTQRNPDGTFRCKGDIEIPTTDPLNP